MSLIFFFGVCIVYRAFGGGPSVWFNYLRTNTSTAPNDAKTNCIAFDWDSESRGEEWAIRFDLKNLPPEAEIQWLSTFKDADDMTIHTAMFAVPFDIRDNICTECYDTSFRCPNKQFYGFDPHTSPCIFDTETKMNIWLIYVYEMTQPVRELFLFQIDVFMSGAPWRDVTNPLVFQEGFGIARYSWQQWPSNTPRLSRILDPNSKDHYIYLYPRFNHPVNSGYYENCPKHDSTPLLLQKNFLSRGPSVYANKKNPSMWGRFESQKMNILMVQNMSNQSLYYNKTGYFINSSKGCRWSDGSNYSQEIHSYSPQFFDSLGKWNMVNKKNLDLSNSSYIFPYPIDVYAGVAINDLGMRPMLVYIDSIHQFIIGFDVFNDTSVWYTVDTDNNDYIADMKLPSKCGSTDEFHGLVPGPPHNGSGKGWHGFTTDEILLIFASFTFIFLSIFLGIACCQITKVEQNRDPGHQNLLADPVNGNLIQNYYRPSDLDSNQLFRQNSWFSEGTPYDKSHIPDFVFGEPEPEPDFEPSIYASSTTADFSYENFEEEPDSEGQLPIDTPQENAIRRKKEFVYKRKPIRRRYRRGKGEDTM